jgi:hypothetical protein
MPVTLAQAASQNERWERGRLELLRQRVLPLVVHGLRQRSMLRLDAAIEQGIPPLSVPFALGGGSLVAAVILGDWTVAALALMIVLGHMLHLVVGLVLVRAPRGVFVSLTYAPVYVSWKVGLYMRALVGARSTRWIRTGRAA